ncbi:MAG: PAS domain S-box protein [Leptolyngbyaceae cyanobacterium]
MSRTKALTLVQLKSAIIRDPLVVSPSTSVTEAIARMSALHAHCAIPSAPDGQLDELYQTVRSSCVIVMDAGRIVGIFTERDVVRLTAQQQPLGDLVMRQVMFSPVVTLQESAFVDVSSAVNILQRYCVRHLAIVDDQERLVGLVTHESLQHTIARYRLDQELAARQQAETLLQESTQRYASLVEAVPIGILRTDAVGHCTYVNDRYCQITGLTPETAAGDGWQQGLLPDDFERVTAEWQQVVYQECPGQLEYRWQHPDGTLIWLHMQAAVERDARGLVIGCIVAVMDVSDRKQTELALEQSERTNRTLIETIPDLLIQMDRDGYYKSMSGGSGVLVKYPSVSSAGPEVYNVLPHDLAEQRLHYTHQALASGTLQVYEQIFDFEGEQRFEEVRIAPLNTEEVLVIIRDIHARKRAEAVLQEREQRFRQLFEATPKISVQGYDRHHQLIYWNDASEELYGYTRAEAIGQTLEELIIPPEMRSWVDEVVRIWMNGGPPIPAAELSLMRKNGSRVSVFSSHIMLTNSAGEPEMYCVDIDLSELKQAEAALKASEARWQFALDGAGDGVWDWNIETGAVFFSHRWKSMLQYADDEIGDRTEEWQNRIHPEDKAQCYANLDRYFEGETSTYRTEYRLRCKDGSYKWILARGKVVECTADGQPLRMIGTHKDIDDRKQAETALQNLIAGTAATTGSDFFPALVSHIATALNVSYALVTEKIGNELYTLAIWANGALQSNFSFLSAPTPCEQVLQDGKFYCEQAVQRLFPDHTALAAMDADSYLGIVMRNARGEAIGTLCILDQQPIQDVQRAEQIMSVFAARAAAELERQRTATQLEQLNQALESEVEDRTAALRTSESQIRSIVEAIPDLLLRVARDGTCLEVIQSRYQVGEFIPMQQHLSEILPSALLQQQLSRIDAAIATGILQIYEHQFEKHGRLTHEEIRISAISPDEVLIIVRDITHRKQTQTDLLESQQFIQTVLDTIPLPVVWKDRDATFMGCNQRLADFVGVQSAAELVGKTDFEVAATRDNAHHYRADDHFVMESGQAKLGIEETIFDGEGDQRWIVTHKAPLRNLSGTVVGVVGTFQDITDRKQSENALLESQQFIQTVLDTVPLPVFWKDQNSVILGCNQRLVEVLGLQSPDEIIGKGDFACASTEIQTQAYDVDDQWVMASGEAKLGIEETLTLPTGEQRWLETHKAPLRSWSGDVVGVVGIFQDVTHRKQAEIELRASRAYYRSILSDQTELICRFLPDGTFTFVNDAYCQFFQKTPEELLGQSFTPLMPEADQEIPARSVDALSVDNSVVTYEHRVIAPDGTIAWQQWTERALFDCDGNFMEFQAVGRDITALKEAEEALRESEQRFRRAIEDAPFPIMIHAEGGEVLQLNAAWTELTGYTHEAIPTIQAWAEHAYGDRAKHMLEAVIYPEYALESRWDHGEYSIATRDGGQRIWHFNSAPLGALPDGRRAIITMAADVTQRRELSERLNLAVESAAIGIWDWDIVGDTLVWDERMHELYGTVPDQFTNAKETWLSRIHPEDRDLAEIEIQQALRGERVYDTEFRVIHPDGSIHFLKSNALVQRNSVDEPQRMIGINYDITDRKETEMAMKRQLVAMETAVEGISILQGESFLYVNQAKLMMFGYEHAEELIGKTWSSLYPLEEKARYGQEILPALRRYQSWEGEAIAIRKDGSTFVEGLSLTMTEDGLLICVCRDISERKRTEIQVRSLLNRTQLLNRISSKIRHSLHLDIILQTTVNAIVAELPADICTFAWYRRNDGVNLWEIAKEQKQPELLSWLGSHQLHEFPIMLDCILQNQPYQIDNLAVLEDESFRAFLERAGIAAFLCFPIHTATGKVGSLQIGRIDSSQPWHEEEVELLQDIADQVAIAIHQAHLYEESQAKTKALQRSYHELQETQLQLIQSEKMSSLGQLVAGIAHEINNPMSFIYGNLAPALDYAQTLTKLIRAYQEAYPDPPSTIAKFIRKADIEYTLNDFPRLIASMETGATRIQDIIKSLRTFSRLDRAEYKLVNLHENIDDTLVILQNRLNGRAGKPEIAVIKNYGDLPLVECYGSLLNQVFMNLLANAIDAIVERQIHAGQDYLGCIVITTTVTSNLKVTLSIRDNGMGMSEATQAKIFDPFFTTKPVGDGTGMGLPISYQIVTGSHRGQLQCYSTPGQGTEFVIELWQTLSQS